MLIKLNHALQINIFLTVNASSDKKREAVSKQGKQQFLLLKCWNQIYLEA